MTNNLKKVKNVLGILFFVFLSFSKINAQSSSIVINLNVIPPYSPYISDYVNNQNKTIITLIPTAAPRVTQLNIYFKATLEGDNGVSISSKTGYKPPTALTISALFPTTMNGKQLANYFNTNNMIFKGVTLQQLVNGDGLPEGTYTICLQAFDYDTDLPLSGMQPNGCSAPITIKHPDPPLPMLPNCASIVTPKPIQNILFNWTYNPGYTSSLQYLLKIVPVLSTQNPNDAINTMVTPAFFEKIINTTSYLYGPADPLLTKGQKYAYRIKVYDPQGKILFKNNGESEVCTFTYGEEVKEQAIVKQYNQLMNIEIINPVCGKYPIKDKQIYIQWKAIQTKNKSNYSDEKYLVEIAEKATYLNGKLKPFSDSKIVFSKYETNTFFQSNVSLIKLVDKTSYYFRVSKFEQNKKVAVSEICEFKYQYVAPEKKKTKDNSLQIKGQIVYTAAGKDGEFVLNNTSITAEEVYYLADKNNVDKAKYYFSNNPISNKPIKTKNFITDDNGFIKTTMDDVQLGIIIEDYKPTNPKLEGMSGVLMKGIRLKINSNYYTKIDAIFTTTNNNVLDVGKQYVKVYTFNVTYTVKKGYKNADNIESMCEDCNVSLYEFADLPAYVPKFKKENKKIENTVLFSGYKFINSSKTIINTSNIGIKNTIVKFDNLVCTNTGEHHYLTTIQNQNFEEGDKMQYTSFNDNSSANKKSQTITFISQKLPKSKVKGQIFYTYKGTNTSLPLKTTLLLKVCYVIDNGTKKLVMNTYNIDKSGGTQYQNEVINDFNKKYPDNEKSLGMTTSNESGEFEFNVDNVEVFNQDLTNYNVLTGGGEFKATFSGKVYRCLRVVVNNGYYTNPDNDIFIDPLGTVNVGKITATVKAMKIKVICKSMNLAGQAVVSGNGVPGLDVGMKRKGPMPNYFPKDEGNIYKEKNIPPDYNKENYISYGVTNSDGIAILNDVVISKKKAFEKLTITANSPDFKGDFNYIGFGTVDIEPWDLKWGESGKLNTLFEPDAVYNSDFITPTCVVNVNMIPIPPKITGRVLDVSKSKTGLEGANVFLTKTEEGLFGSIKKDEIGIKTDQNGYFEFNTIKVKKTADGTVIGPKLNIKVLKPGYHYGKFMGVQYDYSTDLGILKEGEQRVLPEIYLTPSATLKGTIKDDKGNPVDCYVGLIGNDLSESKYQFENGIFSSNYEILTPPGNQLKLVVWPKDLKYYIDTIDLPNINNGNNKYDITVYKRLHRFKFKITEEKQENKNGFYITKYISLPNAKIQIDEHIVYTDQNGEAKLEFANTSTKNFTVKVSGPQGENYIEIQNKVTNYESKKWAKYYPFSLNKGIEINGRVTLKGKPITGANVWVDRGAGVKPLEVITDNFGFYKLQGVKLGSQKTIKVFATAYRDDKIIIGSESNVKINDKTIKHDIELQEFSDFDISEFHGYKLNITSIKLNLDGSVNTKGWIDLNNYSNDFKLSDNGKVTFSSLKFKKGSNKNKRGMIEGLPLNDELILDNVGVNLKYGKHINVSFFEPLLFSGKTMSIKKIDNDNATITGYANIIDNSFDFPGSYLSFGKSQFYFGNKDKTGNDKTNVSLFNSSNKKIVLSTTYNLCDIYGNGLKYKFLQFNAESKPETSTIKLNKDKEPLIAMDTKISAHFDNITPSDLNIDIGVFEMNHEKIFPNKGKQNIKFNLEQWVVEVKNWQITSDKGGITSNEGFITAGALNVPFKNFHMQNNLLVFDEFELNELNLGNITKLNLSSGTKTIFGFDQSTGKNKEPHWKLSLVGKPNKPAATFGDIEGLEQGKKINIEVLTLLSNGEQMLSFGAYNEPLLLYNVVKFTPTTMNSYSDYFTLGGIIDYNIPRISKDLSGIIKVVKKGSAASIEIMPQQLEFEGKGYVKFLSLGTNDQKQTISKDKLIIYGTIQEPNETPKFDCKIEKTSYESNPILNLIPNQIVPFGSNKLANVNGSMQVVKSDWDYLKFEGDLQGFSGVNDQAKHLKFVVYGDIKAEGSTIKMDNINTPFGNMEITYDFSKSRLIGHMDVDMDFSESLTVKGVANLLFDKDGFIISVAAQVTAPVVNTFNAGILLGTYKTVPQNFITDVVKYNYNKNIPCHIQKSGLKGFFITGARELPLQVPSFSVDIPPGLALVSLYAGATSGIEVQLAMNFSGGLKLDANILAYAHVWAGINSITCTEAGVDVTVQLLVAGSYDAGKFNIDGCGSIVMNVKGSQKVPLLVGCTSPEISLDTQLGAKYLIHLGSDGFHQGVEFSVGEGASDCLALLDCSKK